MNRNNLFKTCFVLSYSVTVVISWMFVVLICKHIGLFSHTTFFEGVCCCLFGWLLTREALSMYDELEKITGDSDDTKS